LTAPLRVNSRVSTTPLLDGAVTATALASLYIQPEASSQTVLTLNFLAEAVLNGPTFLATLAVSTATLTV